MKSNLTNYMNMIVNIKSCDKIYTIISIIRQLFIVKEGAYGTV